MTDFVENKIKSDDYDLFDRSLYGGIGHGIIVIPTNIFKILFTVIFPPLGEILEIVTDYLLDEFPYITWETIKELFKFENLNKVIYSFILTSLFYVPGLVLTLAHLTIKSRRTKGSMVCDPETGKCVDMETLEEEIAEKKRLDEEEEALKLNN
jgi:hypothetical protein